MQVPPAITINDFLSRLYSLRDAAASRATQETKALVARNAARGLLKSGATLKALVAIIETEFEATLTRMLRVLNQAKSVREIDYGALHDQTFLCAKDLIAVLVSACDMEKWYRVIESEAAEKIIRQQLDLLLKLRFRMRQFDVGLDESILQEKIGVTNNIVHAHTISGVVQQAGDHARLSAVADVNLTHVANAAQELEVQIANSADRDTPVVRQLAAELAVIQAHLAAPEPRRPVISEALKSIRGIAEQAVGGAISPAIITAALTLGSLFG